MTVKELISLLEKRSGDDEILFSLLEEIDGAVLSPLTFLKPKAISGIAPNKTMLVLEYEE